MYFKHQDTGFVMIGCPRMTQLLKCYAPDAFSGAKFQAFLENGHEIDVG